MDDDRYDLSYHGRRSVDEILGAMATDNPAVAHVHRELSLLHLDRFVAIMTAAIERNQIAAAG